MGDGAKRKQGRGVVEARAVSKGGQRRAARRVVVDGPHDLDESQRCTNLGY